MSVGRARIAPILGYSEIGQSGSETAPPWEGQNHPSSGNSVPPSSAQSLTPWATCPVKSHNYVIDGEIQSMRPPPVESCQKFRATTVRRESEDFETAR